MLNNSPPIGAQLAFATHVLDKCFENLSLPNEDFGRMNKR